MNGRYLFLLVLILLLASCSNKEEESIDESSEKNESTVQEISKDNVDYENELNAIQETINNYRNGRIDKEVVKKTVEKHIADLESINSKENELKPVVDSLKSFKNSINNEKTNEISLSKKMIDVENHLNKVIATQNQEEENKMINITKAEGILRNSLAPLVGNVAYIIEGTINNEEISKVELNFIPTNDEVDNQKSVEVAVNNGKFLFTKGYEEIFGYFNNVEIKAIKENGTPLKDSSGNEILIKSPINLTVEE